MCLFLLLDYCTYWSNETKPALRFSRFILAQLLNENTLSLLRWTVKNLPFDLRSRILLVMSHLRSKGIEHLNQYSGKSLYSNKERSQNSFQVFNHFKNLVWTDSHTPILHPSLHPMLSILVCPKLQILSSHPLVISNPLNFIPLHCFFVHKIDVGTRAVRLPCFFQISSFVSCGRKKVTKGE